MRHPRLPRRPVIPTDDYFSLTDRFYTHTDLTDLTDYLSGSLIYSSAIRYITSRWSVDPKDMIRFIRSIRVQKKHPHGKIRVYPCLSVCQKHSSVGDNVISVREFHRMSQ